MFNLKWLPDSFCHLTCCNVGLVPRPFPLLVFDRLQHPNTAGEGLGELVTCDDRGWMHKGWCPTVIIPVSCRSIPVL